MDITTRDRTELKKYFVKNSIPTEENFAELIDGLLNQKDDGLVKLPGNPLNIEAAGDNTSQKKAINFYQSFADDSPTWSLSLNPRSDPSKADTARSGLSISDGVGNSRLFIDQATGRVGVGTTAPGDTLSVYDPSNSGQGGMTIRRGRYATLSIISDNYWAGIELRRDSNGEDGRPHIDFTNDLTTNFGIRISAPTNDSLAIEGGNVGINTTSPAAKLDVAAANRTGTHATGAPLYVTGGIGADSGGIEFRHSDGSQGIGFGFNTIYATGSTPNQDLGLKPRGTGSVVVDGPLRVDGKYVVQNGVDGGNTRGIWMWDADNANWGMYMARSGDGKSLAGGTAVAGAGFSSHAIRLRTGSGATNGLIYENASEQLNLSIRGSDGLTYIRGNVGIGTTNPKATLDVNGNIQINGAIVAPEGTLRDNGGGWVRTYGNTGWYNQTHGGGWYMTDATWIRSHNDKSIYQNTGILRTDGTFQVGSNGNRFVVNTNGNLGIGTTSPTQAKLVVNGHVATKVTGYGYLNRNGANATDSPHTPNYSIWCSQRVAASEFNAVSDGRIKNVIGVSDSRQDLETLTTLQVTDYTFIDVVNKGQGSNKKLIAQQVQRVYPTAVHTTEDFIPHVYAMSASSMHDGEHGHLTITTGKTHGLLVGDTVRIIDDTGTQELEVLSVRDEHTFTVASDRAAENVFVYGKRVDDFLVLDYEAIAMLNVSATQELVKRVDSQQSRIAKLEDENAFLKTKLADIQVEVTQVEVTQVEVTQVEVTQVEVTDDVCPAGKGSVAVHDGR